MPFLVIGEPRPEPPSSVWADIVPATFEVHALIGRANAKRFLEARAVG
jgi:hypothetical protein